MKKIGIITIPDYNNYGNRLQNFAVERFFKKIGYDVETLELNDNEFKQYRVRKLKLILKKFRIRLVVYFFEYLKGGLKKVRRYKSFERFTERHLNVKYHPNGCFKNLKKISEKYDYIVLGSDQIWHPNVNVTPNLFFATFAEPQKTLFFAPSFGVENLPSRYEELVKSNLINKTNLSVREEAGQKIIFELLGEDATVLPDPTLCIEPDNWKALAIVPKCLRSKSYVLKYFLGAEKAEYKKEFDKISHNHNADIFEIANPNCEFGYTMGPQEFLGSILNADYVVTDSFHAVVFCIMFQKSFTVFPRINEKGINEGLDSRIDMLLKKFSLENRKFSETNVPNVDSAEFFEFSEILQSTRQCAIDFFTSVTNERKEKSYE